MRIESVTADHYQIPLHAPLTDSTHGEMTRFMGGQLSCRKGSLWMLKSLAVHEEKENMT